MQIFLPQETVEVAVLENYAHISFSYQGFFRIPIEFLNFWIPTECPIFQFLLSNEQEELLLNKKKKGVVMAFSLAV